MDFPTKNDHFGVFLGVPPCKETPIYIYIVTVVSQNLANKSLTYKSHTYINGSKWDDLSIPNLQLENFQNLQAILRVSSKSILRMHFKGIVQILQPILFRWHRDRRFPWRWKAPWSTATGSCHLDRMGVPRLKVWRHKNNWNDASANNHTVDGSEIPESPVEVGSEFPTIHRVSKTSQVVQDCFHQLWYMLQVIMATVTTTVLGTSCWLEIVCSC